MENSFKQERAPSACTRLRYPWLPGGKAQYNKWFAKACHNSSLFYRSSKWTQGSQQVAVWNNKRSFLGTFHLSEIVLRQGKVISYIYYFGLFTLRKVLNWLKSLSHLFKANTSINTKGQIPIVLWKVSLFESTFIWQVKHVAILRKPATPCGSVVKQKEASCDLLHVSDGFWAGRKRWFIIIIIMDSCD